VFERILKRMREKIRNSQYVMTLHTEEEMNADGLTIYDVERGYSYRRDTGTTNGWSNCGMEIPYKRTSNCWW